MGIGLRDRLRAGLGTMEEWARDRATDLAQDEAELVARGHQAYGQTLRDGAQMVARTTSELREFAKRRGISQAPATRPSRPAPTQSRASRQDSAPRPTRDQQLLQSASRIVAEARRKTPAALRDAGGSELVRGMVGGPTRLVGNGAGLVTGAVHMGHDLVDGAVLGVRLLDPTDAFRKPLGEAAWDQVFDGIGAVAGGVKEAVTDPRRAAHDAAEAGRKLNREINPMATPMAPTVSGEINRSFQIGRRQGEVAMEVFPYLVGAGELKATAELGAMSKASRIAKYRNQGFSAAQARRLAKPYDGQGHHSILPQRATLPDWLGGGPIPKSILDSPFNVLKPPGMTQGDFYELHYKVDPEAKGFRLRGGGWSGKKVGLAKYGLPQRIWQGTPNATKRAIAGGGIAGTIPFGESEPQ